MNRLCAASVALVFYLASASGGAEPEKLPPGVCRRIVFLGDSITDGNTYPLLVESALRSAGTIDVTAINAGIGGDTAEGMHKRLKRDVLDKKPTLVTFNAGANDSLRGVSVETYEREVRAIAQELKDAGVPLVLLTPNVMEGKPKEKAGARLAQYETALRKAAGDFGLRVAEVGARQDECVARGARILAADGLHPNYEGQRAIARAVLDAMGFGAAAVPARPDVKPLPGIVTKWKITAAGKRDVSAPAAVPMELTLPDPKPHDQDNADDLWLDDFRQLGGAVGLKQRLGGGTTFQAEAEIESGAARTAFFNTGAELKKVVLNGEAIYTQTEIRGWHIGRQSVEGKLRAGLNSISIECGDTFFLSVTDRPTWDDAR